MNKQVTFELSQEVDQVPLQTDGRFPNWLSGTLLRNGPVQFRIGEEQVGHWFDGLGMLHAFSFQKGRVIYSNKFLRSDAYQQVVDQGTVNYSSLKEGACS